MIILVDKEARKRESRKKWRKEHPEKRAAQAKRYQQKHAEQINAYNQAYRLRHKPSPKKKDTDQ